MTRELASRLQAASLTLDLVTTDPTKIKPGKTTAWIRPPELEWQAWHEPPEPSFDVVIAAGTPTNQLAGVETIMSVLDEWNDAETPINLTKAVPVSLDLTGMAGTIAAYQVTIGPMDL